jgi:uncharacterized protein
MAEPVFVDSWGWLGISNRRDPWYPQASRGYLRLRTQQTPLVTTNAVLYEVYENCRRRFGQAAPGEFLAVVEQAVAAEELTIVYTDRNMEQCAWGLYRKLADQDVSFTDCLSFAVMQQLGLTTAFTGDRHFTLLGFDTIPTIKQ